MTVIQQPASPPVTDSAVEDELVRLATMPIAQLRIKYVQLFHCDPPKAFGPDLLRRSIAHRIQEKAYGGLSHQAQRLLDHLTTAYAAKPNGKIVLPRRIKPGSVLVREWKGKSHRVTVLAEGFVYDDKTYTNLSEIAVLITGTRWNGPRFFGLRSKAQDSILPSSGQSRPNKTSGLATVPLKLGGGTDYRKRNADRLGKVASGGNRHGL
jgi:hypothetical protein